jgi:DNA-directed RNA polymerase specialized sigma24 family protein
MSAPYIDRLGHAADPAVISLLSAIDSPWHEEVEAIRAGLRWGRRKQQLLEWVRSQMLLRLSPVERRCLALYYFEDKNYRDAAEAIGVNPSSVYRAVHRGVRKLREAARDHPPGEARRARRRPRR